MIGAGVIGCGMISGNHFHAIGRLPEVEIRAVCDIDAEKLKRAAEEQRAEAVSDWRELIRREDVDAVHVCVPHYLHAEISIAALEAGKHVLCEKPMGVSVREAEAMKAAAEKAGRTLTVCFQNRFNGATARMKEVIGEGKLGRILGGSAFVAWNRGGAYYTDSPWRGRWRTEGGSVLINQAIHTLDLLRYLAGDLRLKGSTMSAKRLSGVIETEDTVDMLLDGEGAGRNCLRGLYDGAGGREGLLGQRPRALYRGFLPPDRRGPAALRDAGGRAGNHPPDGTGVYRGHDRKEAA